MVQHAAISTFFLCFFVAGIFVVKKFNKLFDDIIIVYSLDLGHSELFAQFSNFVFSNCKIDPLYLSKPFCLQWFDAWLGYVACKVVPKMTY